MYVCMYVAKCSAGSARNFRFSRQFPSLNTTFSKPTTKKQCFLQCFRCLSCFSAAVAKENLLKTPAIVSLANFHIFKFCCDIQGSYLIGSLWVSLIIGQSECMVSFFLCTELTLFCAQLTLFCTELPENCIYLYQSELSNFFMYIIRSKIILVISNRARAADSFDFEITCMISAQITLLSVQLP